MEQLKPIFRQNHGFGYEHGGLVATTDFPFDEIEPEPCPHEAREAAAELFRRVMQWTFRTPCNLKTATVRWASLCAGLRPGLINDRTFEDIGNELGVTKQALSKSGQVAAKTFGLKFARQRSAVARQHMANARIGKPGYNTRKKPKAAGRTPAPARPPRQ
jgi:hypothetical protein